MKYIKGQNRTKTTLFPDKNHSFEMGKKEIGEIIRKFSYRKQLI